jgi:spermidine/putrescine-binding protein
MAGAGAAFAQSPSADMSVPAGSAAPLTGETITVYNAQHESLTQAWADAFTRQSGIAVVLRNGDDSELGNQLIAEGAASPADVFLTENSPAMTMVEEAGLFSPVAPETLAQVPEDFRPKSGMWLGIAARTTVFVYNKEMLSEADLPKSMLDLAKPEWEGKWGAAPAGADFQAIVSALLTLRVPEADREDAQRAIAELMAQLPQGATGTAIEVVVDAQMPEGACRFESDSGVIDAGLDTQLAAIRRAVERAAREMAQAGDDEDGHDDEDAEEADILDDTDHHDDTATEDHLEAA